MGVIGGDVYAGAEAPTLERRLPLVQPTAPPDHASEQEVASAATTRVLLRGSEATRARAFAWKTAWMAALGLVTHVLFGVLHVVEVRHPFAHAFVTTTLAAFGSVSAFVWYRLRARDEMTLRLACVHVGAATVFALSLQVLMGPFSPVIALVILGSSFFGLSEERGIHTYASLIATAVLIGHALLVAFEVVPDVGVFATSDAPQAARFAMVGVSCTACLFALWQARSTQRASLAAIEQSAAAARAIQQRDARLLEAHQDLEILRGRGTGRYTGTTVGSWHLQTVIGRGAMGEVYEAVHVTSRAPAAVKVLSHASSCEPGLVQRFLREVDIASRLRGAHLVHVYDAGVTTNGIPYIAMERLEGSDLGALLREEATLDLARASALVCELADGLAVAHAAGVVHRDLKPQNIFLAVRGARRAWTLLDFGIAAVNGTTNGTLTCGDVVGTPGYMSPEQALGNGGDARADIFSLGAVAYRVLTSRAPFVGPTVVALHAVVYEAPPRPRSLAPELPADVERVLALALAKDPDARFASAAAFASAFARAVSGRLDARTRRDADALVARGAWARET